MWKSMNIGLLIIVIGTCLAFTFDGSEAVISEEKPNEYYQASLKDKALVVLQKKCNECHRKENKSVIFTKDNMVLRARKIHKQVFVRQKMPKSPVTLTVQERRDLELWLNSLNL